MQTPCGLSWPASPRVHQGGNFAAADTPCIGLRPLTIYHAFHWRFKNVRSKLDDLKNTG